MKIKFKSFSRNALGKYRPGSVVELPDDEALKFINLGFADGVEDKPGIIKGLLSRKKKGKKKK